MRARLPGVGSKPGDFQIWTNMLMRRPSHQTPFFSIFALTVINPILCENGNLLLAENGNYLQKQ